jgi:hypothetical protein
MERRAFLHATTAFLVTCFGGGAVRAEHQLSDTLQVRKQYSTVATLLADSSAYADGDIVEVVLACSPNPVLATYVKQSTTGSGVLLGAGSNYWLPKPNSNGVQNILAFNPHADGVADDSSAFRLATGIASKLFIPAGTYFFRGENSWNTDGFSLTSNIEIFGEGDTTILKQDDTCKTLINANQGRGGTTSISDNIKNVHLHDFKILGSADGLIEQHPMINLNAVSDVVIDRLTLSGFVGDAIYIGSSNVAGVERHNMDVVVRNCRFDGVTSFTRNGISIIDGTNILIEDNFFTNIGASGEPGCVDIEPNSDAFAIIKNITIRRNRFTGGNASAIAILLKKMVSVATTPPVGITVEHNVIDGCYKAFAFSGYAMPTDASPRMGISLRKNVILNCKYPATIDGVAGAVFSDNLFKDCPNYIDMGYTKAGNTDVKWVANYFIDNARKSGSFFWVRNNSRITFDRNVFIDNGNISGKSGTDIKFLTGFVSTGLTLERNKFLSPRGFTTVPLYVEGTHVIDSATLVNTKNVFAGSPTGLSPASNSIDRF